MTVSECLLLCLELRKTVKIYSSIRPKSYLRNVRSVFQVAEHCMRNGIKVLNRGKYCTMFPLCDAFPQAERRMREVDAQRQQQEEADKERANAAFNASEGGRRQGNILVDVFSEVG